MGGQGRCQELTEVYMINVLVFWMLFPEWIQMEEIKNNNKNITDFSFLLQIKNYLFSLFFLFFPDTPFFLGKVLFPTKKLPLSHAPQNKKEKIFYLEYFVFWTCLSLFWKTELSK